MIKTNKEINRMLTWIIVAVNILAFINDRDEDFVFFLKMLNFPLFLLLALKFYTQNKKILFFTSVFFIVIYNPITNFFHANRMGLPTAIFLIGYSLLTQSKKASTYQDNVRRFLCKTYENKKIISRYIIAILFIAYLAKSFHTAFYSR